MGTFFWVFEGRGWRFQASGNQQWLYDRENRVGVVFQREGQRYVVIQPHCIPEQSAPTLEAANGLAKQVAVWALPLDPDTDRRVRTVNNWDRIRRETAWGRRKSNTETARDFAQPDEILAGSAHVGSISADLEIPTFLRRELTGAETRQLAGQSLLAHVKGVLNRE